MFYRSRECVTTRRGFSTVSVTNIERQLCTSIKACVVLTLVGHTSVIGICVTGIAWSYAFSILLFIIYRNGLEGFVYRGEADLNHQLAWVVYYGERVVKKL